MSSGCEGGSCSRPPVSTGEKDFAVTAAAAADAASSRSGPSVAKAHPSSDDGDTLKLNINVISDTMCPWCWVGKRNMEAALRNSPHVRAEVDWWPFFLDKNLPEDGKPVRDYYRDNYGDPEAGERMEPHLVVAGRKVGIDFERTYVKLERYRPTIRSHRLIEFAKRQGRQDAMVEGLFRMYYIDGGHLNSVDDLVRAAEAAGVVGAEEYLKTDEDEREVYEKAARVQHMASGVPTFLVTRADQPNSRPMRFSGGQPPKTFLEVFEHLSETK